MSDNSQTQSLSHSAIVPRPRIEALLDGAFLQPLVVVDAGAGFGKTTAMSQYLANRDYRAVWFSFAALDNLPTRFWEHLTLVFAQHRPALGEKMAALGFPETLQSFGNFLVDMTSELYHDAMTVVFVFDNAHQMTNAAVQAFMANLIAARLENSHIVLITRDWPIFSQPLPLVPQMLKSSELRFSAGETAELLAREGLHLDHAASESIRHYVSGWPIALSLVVMSLRRNPSVDFRETALTATKPGLYSLFEHEIFSQYTPSEQDLLIKLSALDSFPRGLVQAVTGDQARDLEQLLNGNIFISYNADTQRLSFHPMYRDYLRDKLLAVDPAELCETYMRAAEWCRSHGHLYDAASYYGRCGNYEGLWDILQHVDMAHHSKAEADFFIEQAGHLPADFRRQHPMTGVMLAAVLVNNLRFTEAENTLDEALRQIEDFPTGTKKERLLGEYYISLGFYTLAMERNGFEKQFKRAAELLPDGSGYWDRKLRILDLGPGLNLQSEAPGELDKSLACFTEGVPYMVTVLHGAGQGLDWLCKGEALFLTGEPKRALEPAYQSLYAAEAAEQYDIAGSALLLLLRAYMSLGNYSKVCEVLGYVRRFEADASARNIGIWDIIHAWLYAEMEEVEKIALWISTPVLGSFAPISMDRVIVVRMRCLIAAEQYIEALALLAQYDAQEKEKHGIITNIYTSVGRAIACSQLGRAEDAAVALKAAYDLAHGNGIVMPFIEFGTRVRSLLERVQRAGGSNIPDDWMDKVHARTSTYAKHHSTLLRLYRQEQEGQAKNDVLSPRETELLKNLSQGFTREELAQNMQLSPNTIKSLTKQVFAKLGAVNATHAVHIATATQLI